MKVKNLNVQPTALLAELVGTFILATVAVTVANPLIVGFTLVVLVFALGAISGAHLNPAVTFGLWSVRKINWVTMLFYFAMQFAGALLALLLVEVFQGKQFGISFASFGSLDSKILLAELFGAAAFTFAVAAAVQNKFADVAKAFTVGLGLLVGLAIGGGLLGQAAANLSYNAQGEVTSRIAKVDGVVINPAIALAVSEQKAENPYQQQLGQTQTETNRPASRLTLEVIVGGLLGGAIGMNLYSLINGVNPFAKKETVAAQVTKVFKKGKK